MSRILIIEDDAEILEALSELLGLENYEVFTAGGGKEGIRKAINYQPDLIICDIMMPEIDGYEVLQILRQNPATFAIPFLFLTAKTSKSDIRQAMGLGADDYIVKPYEDADILRAVESRIQKHTNLQEFYDKKIQDLYNYIASSLPEELCYPLNTIIGFTQILKNRHNQLNEEHLNLMYDSILDSGNRLLNLVINYTYYATLLDLSVDERHYPEFFTQHTQTLVYNEAITVAKKFDRINDLTMSLTDTEIEVAGSHLIKITKELLDNAFRYSEKSMEVTVETKVDNDMFIINVSNKGPGMNEQQIKKVSPFMKFGDSAKQPLGAGLGLSIVKKIADIYHGNFEISSDPNKTTCVSVELPLKRENI